MFMVCHNACCYYVVSAFKLVIIAFYDLVAVLFDDTSMAMWPLLMCPAFMVYMCYIL